MSTSSVSVRTDHPKIQSKMPHNTPIKIVHCFNCKSPYDMSVNDTCPECGYDPMEADIYSDFDKLYDETCNEEADREDNSI